MNRQDRAKQFMPFDALKGLQEALRSKEERRSRVEKIELNDEMAQALSDSLAQIGRGTKVQMTFYYNGHYVDYCGEVTDINIPYKFLVITNSRVYFNDIYEMAIVAK